MTNALSQPRVAIVHDWLVGGGGERVVAELHRMYPDAPIYTSYCSDEWRKKFDNKVVTGYLQHLGKIRKYIPFLRILWFSRLNLKDYDLIISTTGNGEAKFALSNEKWQMKNGKYMKRPLHICYCFTPVHFYWRHYDAYLKHPGFGFFDPLARLGLRLLVNPLKRWDYNAAQSPDEFIAISSHIQKDILKYYGRKSTIVHPPVDVERFGKWQMANGKSQARKGFVTVARLVPNKRVDVIVEACTKLSLPLVVIGRGPDYKRLRSLAGPSVTFDTNASDEQVAQYLASAEAFLFASFEDFGIAPVEAMAAGTPVIAYKSGGALDYVVPGKTGEFFDDQTPESLIRVIREFKADEYNPGDIKSHAKQFTKKRFQEKVRAFIISTSS